MDRAKRFMRRIKRNKDKAIVIEEAMVAAVDWRYCQPSQSEIELSFEDGSKFTFEETEHQISLKYPDGKLSVFQIGS